MAVFVVVPPQAFVAVSVYVRFSLIAPALVCCGSAVTVRVPFVAVSSKGSTLAESALEADQFKVAESCSTTLSPIL